MKRFSALVCLSLALVWTLALGCRPRGGDGLPTDGEPTDGEPTDGELAPQQKAAVDAVVDQLEVASKALTSFVDGFTGVDADTDGSVAGCPDVSFVRENGVTSITVDYGDDGCTNAYYGDSLVSGAVSVNFNRLEQTLSGVFDDFTIGHDVFAGSFDFNQDRDETGRRVLTGTVDIAVAGHGSTEGTLTMRVDVANVTLSIEDASLTLTDADGVSYSVSVTDVVIDPIDNRSFVPESGTAEFEGPVAGSDEVIVFIIEFTAQSPVDGTVLVTIGDAPPVEYQIPGVGN